MSDEARARKLAEAAVKSDDIFLDEARELREGWYFPFRIAPPGSQGVIINKKTGRPFPPWLRVPSRTRPHAV
jgi:hypothetical protein